MLNVIICFMAVTLLLIAVLLLLCCAEGLFVAHGLLQSSIYKKHSKKTIPIFITV